MTKFYYSIFGYDGIHHVDTGTTAASQWWFWTSEWQAGEREVDADLAAGRFGTFDSMGEFLADLGDAGAGET